MNDEERQRAEFKEKLRSLHFGIVPGGYRDSNSTSSFDHEAVEEQLMDSRGDMIFSEERVRDKQSDFRKHYRDFQSAAE
jgi:hypothetical protein